MTEPEFRTPDSEEVETHTTEPVADEATDNPDAGTAEAADDAVDQTDSFRS
jgi:hypothetical protein